MERDNSFVAILKGRSGKHYSAFTNNLGKIPIEENPKKTDLVYDYRTKVIYYQVRNGKKIACMLPYLSENGKLCRLVEDKIVEI